MWRNESELSFTIPFHLIVQIRIESHGTSWFIEQLSTIFEKTLRGSKIFNLVSSDLLIDGTKQILTFSSKNFEANVFHFVWLYEK